jgi:hypothetical protein
MAESTHERAVKQGLDVGDVQAYGAGDTNFASYIYNGSADAWIVFGEARDTADVVRSLKKLTYAPRLFFARSAADPRFVRLVGQDAEFALAVKEYDPKFRTLGNDQFAAAFEARWSAPATFAAAQGYAAGTVLAEAVRRTKSLDQEKLRATLAEMETDTVLRRLQGRPRNRGAEGGAPAVVQIQRGKAAVIWPEWLQSSTLQPIRNGASGRSSNREKAPMPLLRSLLFAPGNVCAPGREGPDPRGRRRDRRPRGLGRDLGQGRRRASPSPRRSRGRAIASATYASTRPRAPSATPTLPPRSTSASTAWLRPRSRARPTCTRSTGCSRRSSASAALPKARSTSSPDRDRGRRAAHRPRRSRREASALQGPWRVKRVAFGAADYAHELGLTVSLEEPELAEARARIVPLRAPRGWRGRSTARGFHFKEAEAFERALERSRRGGFQGRLCVHPDQIGRSTAAYMPTDEELARAERIVALLQGGRGARARRRSRSTAR